TWRSRSGLPRTGPASPAPCWRPPVGDTPLIPGNLGALQHSPRRAAFPPIGKRQGEPTRFRGGIPIRQGPRAARSAQIPSVLCARSCPPSRAAVIGHGGRCARVPLSRVSPLPQEENLTGPFHSGGDMATNHDGQSRDDKLERWLQRVSARHLWVAAVPGATLPAYL